jgi:hypothetical protein
VTAAAAENDGPPAVQAQHAVLPGTTAVLDRWTTLSGKPAPRLSGPCVTELEARRWPVRGALRTRDTFADPHPDDHPGTDTDQ